MYNIYTPEWVVQDVYFSSLRETSICRQAGFSHHVNLFKWRLILAITLVVTYDVLLAITLAVTVM